MIRSRELDLFNVIDVSKDTPIIRLGGRGGGENADVGSLRLLEFSAFL